MNLSGVTIGQVLRSTAQRVPEKIALVGMDESLSFAELDERVDQIARGLHASGIRRGDTVALWVTNTPTWVAIWIAVARIGAILVPINTRFKADEAAYVLKQSGASILIMMDRYWSIDYIELLRSVCPELSDGKPGPLNLKALPQLRTTVVCSQEAPNSFITLNQLINMGINQPAELESAEALVQPDDPVIIVYTSGTTGHPKGVVHSHVVLRNAYNIARTLNIDEHDVLMGHMPFYHVAGAFSALLPAIILGCRLVIMESWDPQRALKLIQDERISYISGIPTHFIDLIDAIKDNPVDTTSLRTAWIGGASVTPEVVQSIIKNLKLPSIQAVYGMTETTSTTTLSGYQAPLNVICENKGRPIGEFEVKVFDTITNLEMPVNEVGEIWVRGHIVMLGYYKDPEATAKVMTSDGWFKTGDLGAYDKDGYLKITGRVKEMFIVGGSNAYPAEIERIIQEHPSVRQAVVVGVPDKRLGEVGFAFIELNEKKTATLDEIIAYCKGKMADYKVPRHIQFMEGFPRTTTGKLQRNTLQVSAKQRLLDALKPLSKSGHKHD
ncbi:MAG: AMP-binding protein [Burkholderiaceae bacterium]|nr:AMP-binding protein [Burkholderiaceae bacterium]